MVTQLGTLPSSTLQALDLITDGGQWPDTRKDEIIHLETPISSRQCQLEDSTRGRTWSMAKKPRKTRYSSSNCIQDIFGFICNYVLSFSKPDQKYIVEDYFDHQSIDESQEIISLIVDYERTHTPVHIPDAPVETLVRHKPPALSPTLAKPLDGCKPLSSSSVLAKVPDWYKPLDLPPILHDLPVNYINNMPRFDGENANITAEKHIQSLEDFLNPFEV